MFIRLLILVLTLILSFPLSKKAVANDLVIIKLGDFIPEASPGTLWKIVHIAYLGTEFHLQNVKLTAQQAGDSFMRLRVGGVLPGLGLFRHTLELKESDPSGFSDVMFAVEYTEKDLKLVREEKFSRYVYNTIHVGMTWKVSPHEELPKLPSGYIYQELTDLETPNTKSYKLVKTSPNLSDVLQIISNVNIWAQDLNEADALKLQQVTNRVFHVNPALLNDRNIEFGGGVHLINVLNQSANQFLPSSKSCIDFLR